MLIFCVFICVHECMRVNACISVCHGTYVEVSVQLAGIISFLALYGTLTSNTVT